VADFVKQVADSFGPNEVVPADLDVMLLNELNGLVQLGIVILADRPQELAYYLV